MKARTFSHVVKDDLRTIEKDWARSILLKLLYYIFSFKIQATIVAVVIQQVKLYQKEMKLKLSLNVSILLQFILTMRFTRIELAKS